MRTPVLPVVLSGLFFNCLGPKPDETRGRCRTEYDFLPFAAMEAAAEGALGVLLPSLEGARTPVLGHLSGVGTGASCHISRAERSEETPCVLERKGFFFSYKKRPTLISQIQASVCRFLSQLLTPGRAQGRHHHDEVIARQPLPLPPLPHSESWEPGLCTERQGPFSYVWTVSSSV